MSSEFPDGVPVGAWGFPKVAGRCPVCRSESLFLAVGGHITCAVLGCTNPTAVDDWLHHDWTQEPLDNWIDRFCEKVRS